jgi:hypothetical protein
MLDDNVNIALGLGSSARLSNDAAVFLSKKVVESQREIVHQLRTEVADHTRPETAKKEADKGRLAGKEDENDETSAEPGGDAIESASQETRQLDISV